VRARRAAIFALARHFFANASCGGCWRFWTRAEGYPASGSRQALRVALRFRRCFAGGLAGAHASRAVAHQRTATRTRVIRPRFARSASRGTPLSRESFVSSAVPCSYIADMSAALLPP